MNYANGQERTGIESENDDTGNTSQLIVSRGRSSVVSHLLEIQDYASNVRKAHVRAENPLCLMYEEASRPCFKAIHNRNLERPFVAISWTWQPSGHEDGQSGIYLAEHSEPRGVQQLEIRNDVLCSPHSCNLPQALSLHIRPATHSIVRSTNLPYATLANLGWRRLPTRHPLLRVA